MSQTGVLIVNDFKSKDPRIYPLQVVTVRELELDSGIKETTKLMITLGYRDSLVMFLSSGNR